MIPVFDLHADIGYDVMQKKRKGVKDILDTFHIAKLKKGGVHYICMASNFEGNENWQDMQEMILSLKEEVLNCHDIHLVLSGKDFCKDSEQIQAVLTVEGMCGIMDDVEDKITWLYEQGIRIASLCWNDENALATGVKGNKDRGLTALGHKAIQNMIDLHMMIDVSHANEKTFWDIMQYNDAIVMATHSNARMLCDHPRNLYEEQIKAIAEHHGIIGMVSAPGFVSGNKEEQDLEHMVQHMQYMKECIGIKHISLGLDYMDFYEGYDDVHVKDLKDASFSQNLIEEMLHCGMKDTEARAIAYQNAYDFLTTYM